MSISSVSSATTSQILQNTVTRLQSQLDTASSESSTGLLADIGLTLGAESGQDVAMHQQMADLSALTASNGIVSMQLSTASNALTGLQTSTSSVLSAIIAATGSAGSTAASALQETAASALSQFSTTMNTAAGGVYVFGGINSGTAPMASYTTGSAAQTAVQSAFQSFLSANSVTASTMTGAQMTSFLSSPAFTNLFSGAGWSANWSSASDTPTSNRVGVNQTMVTSISANQSAFQQTAQALTMVTAFAGQNLSTDAYTALLDSAQTAMGNANTGLIEANAQIGTMQNQLNDADSAITLQTNVLTTQINSVEAVNSYQVATQVSNLTNQLQVAYSLTSQIHKLSLVNFL